jgi:multidrug resistance efflux pump
VRRRIDELEADLAANVAREKSLKLALDRATEQQTELSEAEIVVPRRSRVWEVLATPGEQVNRGQDLVRLLSCEEAVVTVAVSETVYNSLYLNMPAEFIPRGASEGLQGSIVNLTGMAGASSNYAIDPSALVKEPYRVTVAVPSLASANKCDIGRTGRVLFGESAGRSSSWHILQTIRSIFQ